MQRIRPLLFALVLMSLCWFAMMAVHELGHVVGAWATGGHVERVVLSPLAISRTDVIPNPQPGIVVWLGPIVGCLLPMVAMQIVPRQLDLSRKVAQFFSGFCLIANGAYIAFGLLGRVGDCGEMLRTGTPPSAMVAFGAVTISIGLFQWHRLGSLQAFLNDPQAVSPTAMYAVVVALITVVLVEFTYTQL